MAETGFWEKVLSKKEDIVAREIAGEVILVPIRGTLVELQKVWSLNPVGGFIWKSLDGHKNLSQVRDEILAGFEVRKEQAEADIEDFVQELLKADLVW